MGLSGSSVASIEVTQVTQGLTGADGGASPGTGDSSHVHNQSVPSAEWTVDHNLGKWPSVSVVDSANDLVEGEVKYINPNRVILNFSAPFTGRAFIN